MNYEDFLKLKSQASIEGGFEPVFMPDMAFDFQRHLIDWSVRQGRGAIFADCGLGKSLLQLAWAQNVICKTNKRVLILAPLAVSQQFVSEGDKFGIEVGLSRDGKPQGKLTVINYERLHKADSFNYDAVVCDECFPAGTLIDTPSGRKYIQDFARGDKLLNASGVDYVAATKKRRVYRAVRVTTERGTITCSENHPFFTVHGWRCAKDLRPSDYLMETTEAMRLVRSDSSAETLHQVDSFLQQVLLSEMAYESSRAQVEGSYSRDVRQDFRAASSVAQKRLPKSKSTDREDSQTKSFKEAGCTEEDFSETSSHEAQADCSRWKREGTAVSTVGNASSAWGWMDSRISNQTRKAQSCRLSDVLQSGCRQSRVEDSNRSGWEQPPFSEALGQKERQDAGYVRVDSVEVLESTDSRLDQFRDADGFIYFYDIEATRHPSFSVDGILVHNSSILKHWSGKTQKQVTRFLSKMRYRLLSTATPAPNDFVELGTSSEALGFLDHTEMLATFFRQISDDEKRRKATATDIVHSKRLSWRVIQSIGQYALKAHAFEPFWRWVSSWARACRKPSDLGPYDDSRFVLPPLNRFDHVVTPRQPPPGFLFTIPAFGLNQELAERRRTIEERTELVAKLVDHNEPAVVWCQLKDEGDALEKSIPDAVQVKGSQSLDEKEERLISFLRGESRVLITKAKIAGLGLNMQHCAHVVTFVDHCYDAITEILTRDSGWVTFDKVSVGDYVATINQSTLEMEWQSCSDVIWSHYEGDMIHFCGERNFDLVVTPNHNMFVRQCPIRFVNGIGWHLKRADEIDARFRRQEYRMLSCPGSWNGSSPKFVEIPVPENLRINASTKIVSKIASESLARLAAWYVSEGHARPVDSRHGGQIVICQTDKHPQNRSEIIELVRSIGLQVNCKTKDITFYSKQLATFLHDNFGHLSHRKRIPRWMKEWDSSLLEVIRDTMIRGDGCHDSLGVPRFYRTTSRELADDFQEICLKTGLRASVRERGMTNSIDGRPVFDVSIAWQNTMPSVHKSPVRRPYDGMIGCVTVPNGVVIVRRNGIPVVSGNSFEKFYQSVRRCWRFGQTKPVRLDVISTEGEVNVRTNMERKERQAEQMFESIVQFMNQSQHVESRTPSQKAEVPEWMSSRA